MLCNLREYHFVDTDSSQPFHVRPEYGGGYVVTTQAESLERTVLRIIGDHLGIPSATLRRETDILTDLNADSLDLIELVMTVEEKFGISIPDQMTKEINNIDSLVEVVAKLVSER